MESEPKESKKTSKKENLKKIGDSSNNNKAGTQKCSIKKVF